MLKKLFKKHAANIPFAIFIVCCLLLYVTRVSTDIVGGDIGDLVTAAYVAGVAHPPGYPLFVLLGHIFTMIPLPVEPVVKVGYISALSSIVSLFLFYVIVLKLTKDRFVALLTSSVLAFSYLFWFYSEVAEVFALNNALCLLFYYLALQFYLTKKQHYIYLMAFVFGLGLTNHHTIVLLVPSAIILVIPNWKKLLKLKWKLLLLPALFLLGISPYLYVPIASSFHPPVNWQQVQNFQDLFDLFTRRAYGTFSSGMFEAATFFERLIIFKYYWVSTISSITLPIFAVGIFGMVGLFLKKKFTIFSSILLAFLLTGPIFNFYAGFPLVNAFIVGVAERFNLLSSIFLLFSASFGLFFINETLQKIFSKKLYASIIMLAFLIIPIMLFYYNGQKTNLSHSELGTNMGKDYLTSLPKDTVLFASGDSTLFNVWYVYYVLGVRPDVEVVELGGLANSSFMDKAVDEIVKKNIILSEQDSQAANAILYISQTRPVYFTGQFEFKDKNIVLVPLGLSLQAMNVKEVPSKKVYLERSQEAWENISLPFESTLSVADTNPTSLNTVRLYAEALTRIGFFLSQQYGDSMLALEYFNSALMVYPNASKAFAGRGTIKFETLKQCREGEEDLKKAVSINPVEKNYYVLLDILYRNCYKDSSRQKAFREEFKFKFGKEFLEAFPTVKN